MNALSFVIPKIGIRVRSGVTEKGIDTIIRLSQRRPAVSPEPEAPLLVLALSQPFGFDQTLKYVQENPDMLTPTTV